MLPALVRLLQRAKPVIVRELVGRERTFARRISRIAFGFLRGDRHLANSFDVTGRYGFNNRSGGSSDYAPPSPKPLLLLHSLLVATPAKLRI